MRAEAIDAAVSDLAVQAVNLDDVALASAVEQQVREDSRQADRRRHDRIEALRHAADLALRRYCEVVPANRMVATTLESRENARLRQSEQVRAVRAGGRVWLVRGADRQRQAYAGCAPVPALTLVARPQAHRRGDEADKPHVLAPGSDAVHQPATRWPPVPQRVFRRLTQLACHGRPRERALPQSVAKPIGCSRLQRAKTDSHYCRAKRLTSSVLTTTRLLDETRMLLSVTMLTEHLRQRCTCGSEGECDGSNNKDHPRSISLCYEQSADRGSRSCQR